MCSSSRHYEHLTIESSHDAFLRSHRRIPPRTSLSTSRRTDARSCCARSASLCASWSYVAPEYRETIVDVLTARASERRDDAVKALESSVALAAYDFDACAGVYLAGAAVWLAFSTGERVFD